MIRAWEGKMGMTSKNSIIGYSGLLTGKQLALGESAGMNLLVQRNFDSLSGAIEKLGREGEEACQGIARSTGLLTFSSLA